MKNAKLGGQTCDGRLLGMQDSHTEQKCRGHDKSGSNGPGYKEDRRIRHFRSGRSTYLYQGGPFSSRRRSRGDGTASGTQAKRVRIRLKETSTRLTWSSHA